MKMKIITVIGARPQIIKAAAISRAIRNHYAGMIHEIIVHTGQHYDANMSQVFFDELGIPAPDHNLQVGSGSHGRQTAAMIEGIEEILVKERPQAILLYGDTNSTLAGAVAASKLQVPVVHVEAGLRSRNKAMPEEINRIVCDHVSTLLFSPTKKGFDNLVREGFDPRAKPPFHADNPGIYHCGDVMYDNSMHFSTVTDRKTSILKDHVLEPNRFALATIHRNNNTDEPARLTALLTALNNISITHGIKVVLPLHPRTSALLDKNVDAKVLERIRSNGDFRIIPPVSFLDMIALEKSCLAVLTDSGGVQKEAFYFRKPCVIMRSETEWTELVECGAAIVADADESRITSAFDQLVAKKNLDYPPLYGDGHAAEFICGEIVKQLAL